MLGAEFVLQFSVGCKYMHTKARPLHSSYIYKYIERVHGGSLAYINLDVIPQALTDQPVLGLVEFHQHVVAGRKTKLAYILSTMTQQTSHVSYELEKASFEYPLVLHYQQQLNA